MGRDKDRRHGSVNERGGKEGIVPPHPPLRGTFSLREKGTCDSPLPEGEGGRRPGEGEKSPLAEPNQDHSGKDGTGGKEADATALFAEKEGADEDADEDTHLPGRDRVA